MFFARTQAVAVALVLSACDDDEAARMDATLTDAAVTDALDSAVADAAPGSTEVGRDGEIMFEDASPGAFAGVCAAFNPDVSTGGIGLLLGSALGWRVQIPGRARIQRLAVAVETVDPAYRDAGMPELTLGLVRLDNSNDEPDRPVLGGADTVVARALPLPRTREETVMEVKFTAADGPVVAAGWYAILVTTNVGDMTWVPVTVPSQDPQANRRCNDNTYPFTVPAQGSPILQSASPHLVVEGELL